MYRGVFVSQSIFRCLSFRGLNKKAILSGVITGVVMAGVITGCLFQPIVNAGSSYSFQEAYRSGVTAYRHGDYSKALNQLQQAEQLSPGHINTQYYTAIVLDKLARSNEAAKYYALVSEYGTEPKITAYARKRLASLNVGFTPSNSIATKPTYTNEDANAAVAIPLMNQRSALMLNATLDNQVNGTFIVDTGATYTSISQEMADELGDKLTHIGQVRITTANGQINVPKVLIKEININGLVAHNVEATIINLHKGGKFDGLLGLSFIRHFQLTIDPVANQLLFKRV
jgi:clan AA aspartic protease (TIGR02281 family)